VRSASAQVWHAQLGSSGTAAEQARTVSKMVWGIFFWKQNQYVYAILVLKELQSMLEYMHLLSLLVRETPTPLQ